MRESITYAQNFLYNSKNVQVLIDLCTELKYFYELMKPLIPLSSLRMCSCLSNLLSSEHLAIKDSCRFLRYQITLTLIFLMLPSCTNLAICHHYPETPCVISPQNPIWGFDIHSAVWHWTLRQMPRGLRFGPPLPARGTGRWHGNVNRE